MTREIVPLGPWPSGVNNRLPSYDLGPYLHDAVNVDLNGAGHPSRRRGYSHVAAGGHSVWAGTGGFGLRVVGNDLVRWSPTSGLLNTYPGFSPSRPVSYAEVDGAVYLSDGVRTGRLVAGELRPWGVELPPYFPTVTSSPGGGVGAGWVQVTITFLDRDGQESGALPSCNLLLPEPSSITVSSLPLPVSADVETVAVYCSEPDSPLLQLAALVPVGGSSVTISSVPAATARLRTKFQTPMPPGRIVRYYNGRLYVASGKTIYYTLPLDYGHTDPSECFMQFEGDVTVMEPVVDGIFVCAGKSTQFLAGPGPGDFTPRQVLPYGGTFGTGRHSPLTDNGVCWMSPRGLVLGGNGGQVTVPTEKAITVEEAQSGATLFRLSKGVRQILSVSQSSDVSLAAAGGFMDAEVIKGS